MSDTLTKNYIMFIEKSKVSVSLISLGYIHDFIKAWGLTEDGEIEEISDKYAIWSYVRNRERGSDEYWSKYWYQRRRPEWIQTNVTVRNDFAEMYGSLCKRGRTKEKIMKLMSEKIVFDDINGNPQIIEDT